ncbi:MAG TPA: hypothetical protein VGS96_12405, partial [Thermoanaerobaculia bacterium]|nr:hypothetical protein [Thermoanaerobaculia bacterium]
DAVVYEEERNTHDRGRWQGFDPRHVPADRHGIIGMRERARVAGGSLRIKSSRKGTSVVAKVPV